MPRLRPATGMPVQAHTCSMAALLATWVVTGGAGGNLSGALKMLPRSAGAYCGSWQHETHCSYSSQQRSRRLHLHMAGNFTIHLHMANYLKKQATGALAGARCR